MGWTVEKSFFRRSKKISLFQSVQTDSDVHTESYSVVTRNSLTGSKATGRTTIPKLRIRRTTLPLTHMLSGHAQGKLLFSLYELSSLGEWPLPAAVGLHSNINVRAADMFHVSTQGGKAFSQHIRVSYSYIETYAHIVYYVFSDVKICITFF
jgi:hypothetical protein